MMMIVEMIMAMAMMVAMIRIKIQLILVNLLRFVRYSFAMF